MEEQNIDREKVSKETVPGYGHSERDIHLSSPDMGPLSCNIASVILATIFHPFSYSIKSLCPPNPASHSPAFFNSG